jgi:hypothetical protein
VPEISRFLGIIIYIHYNDHNPPHFHAEYGKQRASFSIQNIALLAGKLPPRVISLVVEWALEHQEELMTDWNLAKEKEPLNKIKGLV